MKKSEKVGISFHLVRYHSRHWEQLLPDVLFVLAFLCTFYCATFVAGDLAVEADVLFYATESVRLCRIPFPSAVVAFFLGVLGRLIEVHAADYRGRKWRVFHLLAAIVGIAITTLRIVISEPRIAGPMGGAFRGMRIVVVDVHVFETVLVVIPRPHCGQSG